MNKFFYTIIFLFLVVLSSAQTLTFNRKAAYCYLDSSTIDKTLKYVSDTIKISKSDPNDTIMYYNLDNSLCTNGYCLVVSLFDNQHTPISLADNTIAKNALWARFGFYTGYVVSKRGLYYIRGIVYLKHNPNIRDTVTFYLQMAPTGITTNNTTIVNPIYPNPANSIINLDIEATSIRIIDNLGNIVLAVDAIENNKVDISALASGIYYVESFTKSGIIREKLIKN